mmetsp:Transcript_7004/g.15162  ORF Transcript_7004/g.15162 Transcript_7004/m.15162 type:complete len:126 (-) Transcript_7004:46-423(-)
MKNVSKKVIGAGGIVRGIQNHGVRELPHFFKAKQTDQEGNRYYLRGRFVSIYFDSSPSVLKEVQVELSMSEDVLRQTALRPRDKLAVVNGKNPKKNPYLARALEEELGKEKKGEAGLFDTNLKFF